MSTLRMGWVQHTATADMTGNLAKVESALETLHPQRPQVIILPEAFALLQRGFEWQRSLVEPVGDGPLQQQLARWAKRFGVYLLGGTLPLRYSDGQVYATLCVYAPDGQYQIRYRKMHLFSVTTPLGQSYAENSLYHPGPVPVLWQSPWGAIGLSICYDLRFAELYRYYAAQGALACVVTAAFTRETGEAHWHTLLRARAIENQMLMVGVNQTGEHEQGMCSYGHSLQIDAWGSVVMDAGQDVGQGIFELNLNAGFDLRQQFPVLSHRHPLLDVL